jgi:agmatinase
MPSNFRSQDPLTDSNFFPPKGARFGPRAIRAASARQLPFRGYNARAHLNPYSTPLRILDCGDIPISAFDNALALRQMTTAYTQLGSRNAALSSLPPPSNTKHTYRPKSHPKLITLGGDHSIALASLRALQKIHASPITVVHFDAHLDTWHPAKYPSAWPSTQADFTHGSMFWLASQEGLIANGSSVHAGLRTRLSGLDDWADDTEQGFLRISADDIDDLGGPKGVIEQILNRVGTEQPVYLSLDIDVLDPGIAPGTGTPEPGGWTSREVIRILRGLEGLNVVGADVVEVAPAYDGPGEQTALAAAQVVYEMLTSMVRRGLRDAGLEESKSGSVGGGGGGEKVKDEL